MIINHEVMVISRSNKEKSNLREIVYLELFTFEGKEDKGINLLERNDECPNYLSCSYAK